MRLTMFFFAAAGFTGIAIGGQPLAVCLLGAFWFGSLGMLAWGVIVLGLDILDSTKDTNHG